MKTAIGLLLAFATGVACRLLGVPSPAPPAILGALLVLSMTVGYLLVDRLAWNRANHSRLLCGGPTGDLPSRGNHS
jgi:XapX domain-containing protein